jgi:hypothetical protein
MEVLPALEAPAKIAASPLELATAQACKVQIGFSRFSAI